jgi:hypothetical protein
MGLQEGQATTELRRLPDVHKTNPVAGLRTGTRAHRRLVGSCET